MVVLAGLDGLGGDLNDAAAHRLGLAGQDIYKHGWGVVGNALAEPLFAVRTPRLWVGLRLFGPFGETRRGHLLHEEAAAHILQQEVGKHLMGLLQLGLAFGIQGAAAVSGLIVPAGVVPHPPLALLQGLNAAELVVVLWVVGPPLAVQFAVQPGNLSFDGVDLIAQLLQAKPALETRATAEGPRSSPTSASTAGFRGLAGAAPSITSCR